MKIEIAEHDRMTESGSSLLRLIQNQDMPLLDLLVRESVQNSLDAVKQGSLHVNVDFKTGKFMPKDLNRYFDKVEKPLNERYFGEQEFIEIRDSNTNGLTGPVRYEDVKNNDFGNLLKLIYEICKPQQTEGAGGSWGLGKTIYFRLGIGLVIYYSRIYENGKYKSRLAACLVENETKTNSVIPYDKNGVKRGIAWWGDSDGFGSKHTIPVSNERDITKLLSVFGLEPFENDETGTSVIIPYINSKRLLTEVYALNESEEYKPYWACSLESYLKVAVQRWYAPRIANKYYIYGAYLNTSINGQKIIPEKMLPLFRVIRELYIRSFNDEKTDNTILDSDSDEIKKENINLRNVFAGGQIAGTLCYVKLNDEKLHMLPPDNEKSPYYQITNKYTPMDGGNAPIIMYTRRPGMIVGYDFSGSWTHRMPHTAENEYIIGLFTLNSTNTLKFTNMAQTGKSITLEEYIRQGEKADHASWSDRVIKSTNFRIVQNVQRQVISKVSASYKEKDVEKTEKKNIGLGHAIAEMILPSTDFGRVPSVPSGNGGNGSNDGSTGKGKVSRKSEISVIGRPVWSDGKISYNFELCMKKNVCQIELLVITEFKKYSSESWESPKELEKAFPLSFVEFEIHSFRENAKKTDDVIHELIIDENSNAAESEHFRISEVYSESFNVPSAIRIESEKNNIIIRGKLSIKSADPALKGIFELKEV